MSEAQEHFRWLLTATYRAKNGPITIDFHVEEIAELQALIEHGSGWNALEEIVIRLNRAAPRTPTTRLSERPSDDRTSISPPFSKASRFGCPGLRRRRARRLAEARPASSQNLICLHTLLCEVGPT